MIAVFHGMNGGPAGFGDGREILPNSLAGVGIKAAEFAVAVVAIDVTAIQNWRADDAVQAFGVLFIRTHFSPDASTAGASDLSRSISEPS